MINTYLASLVVYLILKINLMAGLTCCPLASKFYKLESVIPFLSHSMVSVIVLLKYVQYLIHFTCLLYYFLENLHLETKTMVL